MIKKSFLLFFVITLGFLTLSCTDKNEQNPEPYIKKAPAWSYNQTIYEVNIRQYSDEGTIKKVEEQLPRLKETGVGILWLMPVNPIGELNRKGTLGSYYAVKDYKKFNPEFGTEQDFKDFIKKAHELGMYVIIDWVANHTAWDNVWVEEHPEFYTKDSLGNFIPPVADWSDVIDLNYENKELWEAMTDALEYWVRDFDIDGYRCDVAAMVPVEFWNQARERLDKIKPVFLLAEAHEPELHEFAFDMTYNWQLKDVMNGIGKGEKNVTDILKHLEKENAEYPKSAFRMTFTTNHDENSWNGTAYERLGDGVKTFYTLVATLEGMPLLYSGQESNLNKRLQFFEKDPIIWGNYESADFYSKLLNLHLTNKALWNGDMGGDVVLVKTSDVENVMCFTREKEENKVLVILNLSGENSRITLEGENLAGSYTNLNNGEPAVFGNKETISLEPWQYLVYTK